MGGENQEDIKQLQDKVAELTKELESATQEISRLSAELETANAEVKRLERLCKKTESHHQSLREDYKKVCVQLHGYKQAAKHKVDAETQTDFQDVTHVADTVGDAAVDDVTNVTEQQNEERPLGEGGSIAEDLMKAAQEAMQETGFVYDPATGLYYDHNSGYYYESERGLYYEPNSGTYYSFDTETNSYVFHSQVDVGELQRKYQQQHGQGQAGETNSQSAASSTGQPATVIQQATSVHSQSSQGQKYSKPKKRKRRKTEGSANGSTTKCACDCCDHSANANMPRDGSTYISEMKQGTSKKPEQNQNEELRRNCTCECCSHTGAHVAGEINREEDQPTSSSANIAKKARNNKPEGSGLHSASAGDVDMFADNDESGSLATDESELQTESELEDGELTDEEDEVVEEVTSSTADSCPVQWPPCIRVMVQESDSLPLGSLFIITCSGTSIGREKDMGHGIRIPDLQVSKMHADVSYKEDTRQYFIKDHASQNGTFVNEVRITQAKVMGEPYPITHGDIVKIGGSTFLFHVHPGTETCYECEPGQVQAGLPKEQDTGTVTMSKKERETLRRKQLKKIKQKFGLEGSSYEASSSLRNPAYKDKAEERRQTVGSDNPYQRDDDPASVHRAISSENKGHKLLQKMGWSEGEGLGRTMPGIKEPIKINIRTKSSAGLGSLGPMEYADSAFAAKAAHKWVKTKERFENVEQSGGGRSLPQHQQARVVTHAAPTWVKGQTLNPETTQEEPLDSETKPDEHDIHS